MTRISIFWSSVLALLESMQLTALLAWLLQFFAVPAPLAKAVLPEWQYLLKPEWEVAVFRFFVASAVILTAVFVYRLRMQQLKAFIAVEAALTFLMLSALFKKAVYPERPALASAALTVVFILALLNKIFWPQIRRGIAAAGDFLEYNHMFLSRSLMVAVPVGICAVIFVPNVPGVIARFFVGEQFHHNDSFIYGPAFAYLSGCVPNMDIISQYGAGVGVVLGSAMKLFGSFSYESGFLVMMYAVTTYYILCFIFLKRWLDSPAIAAAGIIFMIKVQMFNTGVYPFAFTYGSATVVRFWFDILCFFAVAAHIQQPRLRYLAAAACVCGMQLFYLPTEGVYLTAAYEAYILMHILLPQWRAQIGFSMWRLPLFLGLMVLPLVSAFVLLRVFIGDAVMEGLFWKNTAEFVQYFLSGFGVTPIYSSLLDKQYLASLMGFVLPVVYVLTLLTVGSLLVLGKIHRRHMLVVFICLYGLGTYHYYVARSTVTSYYVVAIPYVMVLCFWVKIGLDRMDQAKARRMKITLLVLSLWALATNHNFLSYPNLLNVSHNPNTDSLVAQPLGKDKPYFNHLFREFNPQLKVPLNSLGESDEKFVQESDFTSDDDLVSYYAKEGDFSVDAALIDRLSTEQEAVPLISSFEIKILMQARRRPYFYYFPLVISHPMRSRNFVTISVYTIDQLKRVLEALEKDKPPYVFMEKLFLTSPVPQNFYDYYPSFMLLRDYVLQNYTPQEQGEYLVAMRRN